MSQIKSIDQCAEGMTVYSPIYGVGKIKDVEKDFIFVAFFKNQHYNEKDYGLPFFDDNKSSLLIQHLYSEPIYLCTRTGFSYGPSQPMIYSYHPVNEEK